MIKPPPFSNSRRRGLRCRCCREFKPEPNGSAECDLCEPKAGPLLPEGKRGDSLGCEFRPWSEDYKRGNRCPYQIKWRRKAERSHVAQAWNRRAKAGL